MTSPMQQTMQPPPSDWQAKLLARDRRAIARAITAMEGDGPQARAIAAAVYPHTGRAHIIGVTGAPGAGKSTLVSALIREFRQQNKIVAVLAIDPTSPISGGAILGDRIRMSEHSGDENVFLRSLATRGSLGGLSHYTARSVDVLDAAGFDTIIIETVGSGQIEVEIAGIAQTVLLVCAPGMGDDIQAAKAGILEVANIVVVNKADTGAADKTAQQLRAALTLIPHERAVPVLCASATLHQGIAEIIAAVNGHCAQLPPVERSAAARIRVRKLIASTGAQLLHGMLADSDDAEIARLCEQVLRGELDLSAAALAAAHRVL